MFIQSAAMSLKICKSLNRLLTSVISSVRFSSYKSDLSLDKVYPHSNNVTPFSPPKSEDGKFSGYIPINELTVTYCKANGPGGQNVNKRSTKVDLRFHIKSAKWLSEETKNKMLEKCVTKINKDGYLVIKSEKTKEAQTNMLDAMTKLREIIYKLEEPPTEISEETAEKLRKQKEKAIRMRLMEKRQLSLKKRLRKGEDFE